MIQHKALGDTPFNRSRALKLLMDAGKVTYAGNRKLKIYGTLSCSTGKRMKPENRVFFTDELEAISCDYRPCGHCMRKTYQKWKELN